MLSIGDRVHHSNLSIVLTDLNDDFFSFRQLKVLGGADKAVSTVMFIHDQAV